MKKQTEKDKLTALFLSFIPIYPVVVKRTKSVYNQGI